MEGMHSIVARHPQRELEIRRVVAHDAGFRAICMDYEEAMAALRHWQTMAADVEAKVQDYINFLAELEAEILGRLNRTSSAVQRPKLASGG